MKDFCDGAVYKNHPVFKHHSALQIILYYDDIETANALGSKAGNKLGMYYVCVCVCVCACVCMCVCVCMHVCDSSYTNVCYTVHGKILVQEKIVNCELFAKIFLANIYRYTENVFGMCTDCSLIAKFLIANSFYLYAYDLT